ncbi:MAG: hypothetical protein JXB36_05715 [Gammaproteobacteria bacterium]|nr:hypothetical protein [Gammaproteobacteria bacterium]
MAHRKLGARSLFVAVTLSAATAVGAHHSQQPFFKMNENLEIQGTVAKFEFTNPHPIIYLDVTDETGAVVQWQIEGPTAVYLTRVEGWSADSLVPGERISVRGAPPKKVGAHAMAGREVVKSDGTRLRLYADDARRVLDQ